MFFGCHLSSTHPFDVLFHKKMDLQHLHNVFLKFTNEYDGDTTVAIQLYASYQKHCAAAYKGMFLWMREKHDCILYKARWMTGTDRVKDKGGNVTKVCQMGLQLCLRFDRACQKCFLDSMTKYQDYA